PRYAHSFPTRRSSDLIAPKDVGLEHALEVRAALCIHPRIVRIDVARQIDLGLGDMQEAVRLAGGAHARLLAAQHVVRGSDDAGRSEEHTSELQSRENL